MNRRIGWMIAVFLLVSLCFTTVRAKAVRLIERPSDPEPTAAVENVERPGSLTGGFFISGQSGNVNITTGEINGSVVSAASSLNLFPSGTFDFENPHDIVAGQSPEDPAPEGNQWLMETGDIRNNATLTALGGVNLMVPAVEGPEVFPQDVFQARQFPQDIFTLNTGDIQSSQVFGAAALNFIPGGTGDLTATQGGTFEANLGNVTEGSTVTLLGTVNITTPSGTNFPQDVFSGTE